MGDWKRRARLDAAKSLGFSLFRLGVVERARRRILSGGRVACISLHDPSPAMFERCIRWLRDGGFTFISVDELVEIAAGRMDPPQAAAWFSLDDGWRGNLSLVPVVERHGVPVTVFLTTEAVERLGLLLVDVRLVITR